MGDDIGSGFVCIWFSLNLRTRSAAQFVIYGRLTTLDNSLSLNPKPCHHPLITQLWTDLINKWPMEFVPCSIMSCDWHSWMRDELHWPNTLFQLETKTTFYKKCWHYFHSQNIFSEKRIILKNLQLWTILLCYILSRVMRVGSDTFGEPIFQKGLQN